MSEARYGLLAFAATMSIASSVAATSVAEPAKGITPSIAKPTLLACSPTFKLDCGTGQPVKSLDKPGAEPSKAAPVRDQGPGRTKTDKR